MSQHIALTTMLVSDYDKAIAWFVERLGFVLREDKALDDGPAGKRWVVVAPANPAPGSHLLLAIPDGNQQARALGNQAGGRVLLFLHTDSFERDHQRYLANGIEFIEGPRSEPYGTVATFVDPFGNRWDLIEPARQPAERTAPTIKTSRFTLRPFVQEDSAALGYLTQEQWGQYLFSGFPSREDYVANALATNWDEELSLVIDDAGQLAGSVHLGFAPYPHVGELACLIAPDRWREGIAVEACTALLDYAFEHTPLHKAVAHCDPRNTGSWRALEKLGLTREGTLRQQRAARDGTLADECCYGVLRDEWLSRRTLVKNKPDA